MMSNRNIIQTLRVAKKYFEYRMDRKDIAREEGISNPTITRMLQKAIDMGYVKITVEFPVLSNEQLAEELKAAYGLKEVFLSAVVVDDKESILQDVCKAAAEALPRYIQSDTVVGTAWGNTMKCLAAYVPELPVKNIKIIQLNGRCSKMAMPVGADDMVDALVRQTGGEGYIIPAPAVLDDPEVARLLRQDSGVKEILELVRSCSTVIFSLGRITEDCIMYRAGYLNGGVFERLKENGAVGDIASNYYDADGRMADFELEQRKLGITLEELKQIPCKIGVVSGCEKAQSLHAALKGGYIDVLYADERLGQALLAYL